MKHVLLVEDDEAIRNVFRLVFGTGNIEIQELENGERIINGDMDAPDLFLLDKNISGTNGLDICRFIKRSEKYKDVPVLMLSASPGIERLAAEAGANGAIAKPFSLKKLRETISAYLH